MEIGKIEILLVTTDEHNCRYEIIRQLGPLQDAFGAGSQVRCSCGLVYERVGTIETGKHWKEVEA